MARLRNVDDLLAPRVAASVEAMSLGPQDDGVAALAISLAKTLDAMDEATRGRMAGQTAGQLLSALKELASRSKVAAGPPTSSRLQQIRDSRRVPS